MAKRKKVVRRRRRSLRGLAGAPNQHGNAAISSGRLLVRELAEVSDALDNKSCNTAMMHFMNANRAFGAHQTDAYWRDDMRHDMQASREYGEKIVSAEKKLVKTCFKAKR